MRRRPPQPSLDFRFTLSVMGERTPVGSGARELPRPSARGIEVDARGGTRARTLPGSGLVIEAREFWGGAVPEDGVETTAAPAFVVHNQNRCVAPCSTPARRSRKSVRMCLKCLQACCSISDCPDQLLKVEWKEEFSIHQRMPTFRKVDPVVAKVYRQNLPTLPVRAALAPRSGS